MAMIEKHVPRARELYLSYRMLEGGFSKGQDDIKQSQIETLKSATPEDVSALVKAVEKAGRRDEKEGLWDTVEFIAKNGKDEAASEAAIAIGKELRRESLGRIISEGKVEAAKRYARGYLSFPTGD